MEASPQVNRRRHHTSFCDEELKSLPKASCGDRMKLRRSAREMTCRQKHSSGTCSAFGALRSGLVYEVCRVVASSFQGRTKAIGSSRVCLGSDPQISAMRQKTLMRHEAKERRRSAKAVSGEVDRKVQQELPVFSRRLRARLN